jgi:hypothetical protein
LVFKNQGKKSDKTRKLGFLRNDCAYGGGESRKPTNYLIYKKVFLKNI